LPLATNTTGSAWQTFKSQRGKYGQEIAFVFRHAGILATSGIEAAQYFAYGAVETFLPIYLNEKLGYSAWEIGLLFTVQILTATFTKPIMGRLSDKYGRLPLITAGLVLGGIATAALILFSNYFVIALMIAVFGLGLATVTASTSCLVADFGPRSRPGGRFRNSFQHYGCGAIHRPDSRRSADYGVFLQPDFWSHRGSSGRYQPGLLVGMRKISVCPPEIK